MKTKDKKERKPRAERKPNWQEYKTTWFNFLLPPDLKTYFYTKTNANRMTKDDLLTLSHSTV